MIFFFSIHPGCIVASCSFTICLFSKRMGWWRWWCLGCWMKFDIHNTRFGLHRIILLYCLINFLLILISLVSMFVSINWFRKAVWSWCGYICWHSCSSTGLRIPGKNLIFGLCCRRNLKENALKQSLGNSSQAAQYQVRASALNWMRITFIALINQQKNVLKQTIIYHHMGLTRRVSPERRQINRKKLHDAK